MERIESETKRNLQYQVEKLEKENAILKTKVDNANEEYRSAVKIWEVHICLFKSSILKNQFAFIEFVKASIILYLIRNKIKSCSRR